MQIWDRVTCNEQGYSSTQKLPKHAEFCRI